MLTSSPPHRRTIHGRVYHRRGPLAWFADQYRPPHPAGTAGWGLAGIRDGLATKLAGCIPRLRPGGVQVITARPWRHAGLLVDMSGAVVDAATVGLIPVERRVALPAAIRDGQLQPRHSFRQLTAIRNAHARGTPQLVTSHEDVIVFCRPGTSASSREPKRSQGKPKQQQDPSSHVGTRVHPEAKGCV